MSDRTRFGLGVTIVLLIAGLCLWIAKTRAPAGLTVSGDQNSMLDPPVRPRQPDRTEPQPISANKRRDFSTLGVLERNAILERIRKGELAAILQSFQDAGRIEQDLTKQASVAATLASAMIEREPSAEFLAAIKEFLSNSSNPIGERTQLIGVLIEVESKETVELLLEVAVTSSDAALRQTAVRGIGDLDKPGNHEDISPSLERVWSSSNDPKIIRYVAVAMAKVGTPSGIDLLLSDAFAEGEIKNVRKAAARQALQRVYTRNAVPALVKSLLNQPVTSERGQLAATLLVRLGDQAASNAVVTWLRSVTDDPTTLVRHLVRQETQSRAMLDAWTAAIDPRVSFKNERTRDAIRASMAERNIDSESY